MSKYTTSVRFLCETLAGRSESAGYNDIDEVLNESIDKIFTDFPIFNEDYRIPLEKKILKHYYTREICEETFGLWKLRLDTKMNEIMPYYNQLYESELKARGYDPFSPVNITRSNVNNKNTNTSSSGINSFSNTAGSDSSDVSRDAYSDTPQGALNNVDSGTYLTNARKTTVNSEADSHASGTSNNTSTESVADTGQFLERITGSYGYNSNASELIKLRESFLNIDVMIIDELKYLFFGLW